MTAGFLGRVPRVALLAAVALLATATLTLAATSTVAPTTPVEAPAAAEPEALVVPDVRRQAYVFAKGTLEQAGFAWRVEGSVQGYAANTVADQSPAPGAKVVATGSPIVVLRLSGNSSYEQEGTPENASPFEGTAARLVGAARVRVQPLKKEKATPQPSATGTQKKTKPAAKAPARKRAARPPAFLVKGAPAEPLDEMSLPARAERLAKWLETHRTRTPRNVDHWLYQHNWIVTGAQFGWFGGAQALRTLIAVDGRVQKLWGVGGRSRQVARGALAEVEAAQR
jgi:PASTA domain